MDDYSAPYSYFEVVTICNLMIMILLLLGAPLPPVQRAHLYQLAPVGKGGRAAARPRVRTLAGALGPDDPSSLPAPPP